jgi:PEP-CTERM motif
MQLTKNLAALALMASLWGLLAGPAAAGVIYSFQGVNNTNWVDVDTGRAQLSVDVSDAGGGKVAFKFMNSGPSASSITAVYFDADELFAGMSIVNGSGVRFSLGATPRNLPGGKNIGFDAILAADSDSPTQHNGINPGESLTVLFDLASGQTYQDILYALHGGVDLRTGLHVQAFSGGGSESFVNNPEPASVLLLGLGFVTLALIRRRRRV